MTNSLCQICNRNEEHMKNRASTFGNNEFSQICSRRLSLASFDIVWLFSLFCFYFQCSGNWEHDGKVNNSKLKYQVFERQFSFLRSMPTINFFVACLQFISSQHTLKKSLQHAYNTSTVQCVQKMNFNFRKFRSFHTLSKLAIDRDRARL